MLRSWPIQEAKNKLSEVIEEAIEKGPQILTRRGVEVGVVLSLDEYLQLKRKQAPLSELFRQSPLEDLDLERDRSPIRPGPSMKSLLVEVDDELASRLERIAPACSLRRSEFLRMAILKVVWEAEEQATAEAYARHPDGPAAAFDPAGWEGQGASGKR